MCGCVCMYVWCVCVHVCVCCKCVHMQSCVLHVCVRCVRVQKRKRDKTITCFEVCVLTTVHMHMHVWGVHVYICSAETSLSS